MSLKNELLYKTEIELKKPKMYNVILHNDDFTTMDFVVGILVEVFNKTTEDATNLMFQIHRTGKAIAGTYTYDIAFTKKIISENIAAENEFPLKITVDEAM